jgi:hypothetical protein
MGIDSVLLGNRRQCNKATLQGNKGIAGRRRAIEPLAGVLDNNNNNNIYTGAPRRVPTSESNPPEGGLPLAGVALRSL